MRFLAIYRPAITNPNHGDCLPSQDHQAAMGQLIEQEAKAGVLLATDGLKRGGEHASVRVSGGETIVTDGPFTEAKEVIGGYAILKVNSRQEAIAAARRFLNVAGDGITEIHELFDMPEPAR
jgi:hypothetical protein